MDAARPNGETTPEAGHRQRRLRQSVTLASMIALLPLVVMAVLLIVADVEWLAANDIDGALVVYVGFALVFVSAARFGQAMRVNGAAPLAAIAGVVSLIAALALLFAPERAALGTLAVGLAATGAWDAWSSDRGMLPSWYGRLRLLTTAIAVPAIVATVVLMPDGP